MDSVSIKGWQFRYVFGCTVGGLNMLWGPFWVYSGSVWGVCLGGPFGAFSLSAFVHAGAFGQKVNFCIFLTIQKEKNKSISSTKFNSKF